MLAPVSETERAEPEAYRDVFAAAPPEIPAQTRAAGGAVALRIAGAPLTELNRIVGLAALAELDELEPLYEGGRVVVSLDPESGLEEELLARGYSPGYAWEKFERGLESYEARTDLDIRDAESGKFGPVAATAFGAPPAFAPWLDALVGREGWHVFVAYD